MIFAIDTEYSNATYLNHKNKQKCIKHKEQLFYELHYPIPTSRWLCTSTYNVM